MGKNKLFIFELVSGGGFNNFEIPSSLFCEGFGMLRTIIEDFKLLNFEINTLLDYRGSSLSEYLKADRIEIIKDKEDYLLKYGTEIEKSDFCFIIAPEFSKHLYKLTEIAKNSHKKVLSIDLEGIALGTYKYDTYKFFQAVNVETPNTYLIPIVKKSLDVDFILQKFKRINGPIVIKPEDGVGAENIFYFDTKKQIIRFFNNPENKIGIDRKYILQKFVRGDNLSVSLIGTTKKPFILSVNSQDINIKIERGKSEYFGGTTPIKNHEEITGRLKKIFQNMNLSMFTGYYGIDFIRKDNKTISFIEINPRLTTSYIGIRNAINVNPAEVILESKMDVLDLIEVKCENFSQFSRVELEFEGDEPQESVNNNIIPNLMKDIPEMVTPPICLNNSKNVEKRRYSCFIATKEKNPIDSAKKFREILNVLKNYDFQQIK